MHVGKYKIAGLTVQIESIYPEVHTLCQDYRCADDVVAQISIHTTQKQIRAEQEKSDQEAILEGKTPVAYEDPYLETLAVYRQMAKTMLMEHDVLLFHGSVIAVEDQAVLFTAKSGTGKSTHTGLWRQMLGDGCYMVNDDKPLLRVSEEQTEACGTPWRGKANLGTNCIVPLKAICILKRGETNQIRPVAAKDVLPMLVQQSFRAEDPRTMLKLLHILDKMAKNVKLFVMQCNMDPEAAKVAYEATLGNN